MIGKVVSSLILLGSTAIGYQTFEFSEQVLFPFHSKTRPKAPSCEDKWLKEQAYANLTYDGVEFACETALSLGGKDLWLVSDNGMRIRAVEAPFEPKPSHQKTKTSTSARTTEKATAAARDDEEAAPVWLHVHGATGNYLHGMRYLPLASELGFRLVSVELSNHGLSENNELGVSYGCREAKDVSAVVRKLLARYPNSPFLISASSMGTMAVSNAVPELQEIDRRNQVWGLALEAPIPSLNAVLTSTIEDSLVPQAFVDLTIAAASLRSRQKLARCTPAEAITKVDIPVMIQQAAVDPLVPMPLARAFAEAIPVEFLDSFHIFDGGAHSTLLNADPGRFASQIKDFWEKNGKRAGLAAL